MGKKKEMRKIARRDNIFGRFLLLLKLRLSTLSAGVLLSKQDLRATWGNVSPWLIASTAVAAAAAAPTTTHLSEWHFLRERKRIRLNGRLDSNANDLKGTCTEAAMHQALAVPLNKI